MMWAPRKNAAPVTSAVLRRSAEVAEAEILALERGGEEIRRAIPQLVSDPDKMREAHDQLLIIETTLPIKRSALRAIEAALPATEEREVAAKFEAQKAELERKTEKLMRTLPDQYTRAAEQFVGVLRLMEDNAREWEQLKLSADVYGLRMSGENAEQRARGNSTGYKYGGSLWRNTSVPAWDHHRDLYPDQPKQMGM